MKAKKTKETGKDKEKALNTPTHAAVLASTSGTTAAIKDLGASPEAEGWKDVLQLLREQNKKMEKLAMALSVIQQGMLRNNPGHVKDSVNEATEVLSGMLNTHKCLLENGVEFQKRLESHPASKRMGIFRRPRSASLGDTPEKLTKGEKRVAPSPPEDRLPKKEKGVTLPTYAAATRGQTPQKHGGWQLVDKKKKKDKKRKRKRNRKKGFLCPLHKTLKRRESCRGALRPPGRAMLSGCRRRAVSPTPIS